MNNFDVEHASSMLVYENFMPEIQHINGKGCIDKYTKTSDVESVTYIDIMRVLPYAPRFRKLGASTNGNFHNVKNEGGYGNAPQSVHYTVPVDLIYDEGVQISSPQIYSNPIALKAVVLAQIVKTASFCVNIITYAKQIEAFFRQGDNFDKALAGTTGALVGTDIKADEIANALYAYDPTVLATDPTSATSAFVNANASLNDGVVEIGALTVPSDERQAFITPKFDAIMKTQYRQNASEAAARINSNGYIDPYSALESNRVDSRTGICGMYDGVDMFMFNKSTRDWVYIALGVKGTADDDDEDLVAVRAILDKLNAFIVYGAGTCRGIVGPNVLANQNPFFGGVYILPQMKVGVEVLHGGTIKMIYDAGAGLLGAIDGDDIALVINTIAFTPINGVNVTGGSIAGFNTGATN